jgi:uncharacterized membrane protein
MLEEIIKWLKDERSSVLSEKSLVTAIGILGGVALGALALPKIKTYAETIFTSFEGATTSDGFSEY